MGVACAPDIFQSKINELLGDIEEVRAYMDDVLMITKGSFEAYLETLERILDQCSQANLNINLLKSYRGLNEVEYLGYIITREGIKPQPKKIEAIMKMVTPKTTIDVRCLVGMIQYYRDMWKSRLHILAPLTDLSKGKKGQAIKWLPEHEMTFQAVKKLILQDTILSYPN